MPIWGTVQNLEEAVIRLPPLASAALETRPSPDPSPGVSGSYLDPRAVAMVAGGPISAHIGRVRKDT
jgi:hypothetical protein